MYYTDKQVKPQNKFTMESVKRVASYIAQRYKKEFGERISEMKLHKLLYFTQRESLIQLGEPLINEEFLAWKYGPVIPSIRSLYAQDQLDDVPDSNWEEANKSVLDFVFSHYAPKEAWSLSRLSHGEVSWRNARKGLEDDENGNIPMNIADIQKDAERMKIRRYILSRMAQLA